MEKGEGRWSVDPGVGWRRERVDGRSILVLDEERGDDGRSILVLDGEGKGSMVGRPWCWMEKEEGRWLVDPGVGWRRERGEGRSIMVVNGEERGSMVDRPWGRME